jgi:predicted porin
VTDYNNMVLAANTNIGDIRVNALYSRQSQATGATGGVVYGAGGADQTGWAIGASMPLTEALTVGVTHAKNNATTEVSMTALSANYALSARSSVYANAANFENAIFKNNAGSAEGLTAYSKSLISVGIQHSF